MYNRALASCSTIGGGRLNATSGFLTTIGGGYGNNAIQGGSNVGGGVLNCALGACSNVDGGRNNFASGSSSTIGGGCDNIALAILSVIGGGRSNSAAGVNATIGGGFQNCTLFNCTTIGGGRSNFASGSVSTIGGGGSNFTLASNATIGGGCCNVAAGLLSTIGGGYCNSALGNHSYIIGGRCSTVSALHSGSAVLGDGQNRPHNSFSEHSLTLDFKSGVYFAQPYIYGSGSGSIEFLSPLLAPNLVYNSGDQIISGIKTFAGNLTVNNTGVLLSGSTPFVINYGHARNNTTAGPQYYYFGPQMDIDPVNITNNEKRRVQILQDCFLRKVVWSSIAKTNAPTPTSAMTGYFKNFGNNPSTDDQSAGIRVTSGVNIPSSNIMYTNSTGDLNIPITGGNYVSFYYQTSYTAGSNNLASGLAVNVDAYFYV